MAAPPNLLDDFETSMLFEFFSPPEGEANGRTMPGWMANLGDDDRKALAAMVTQAVSNYGGPTSAAKSDIAAKFQLETAQVHEAMTYLYQGSLGSPEQSGCQIRLTINRNPGGTGILQFPISSELFKCTPETIRLWTEAFHVQYPWVRPKILAALHLNHIFKDVGKKDTVKQALKRLKQTYVGIYELLWNPHGDANRLGLLAPSGENYLTKDGKSVFRLHDVDRETLNTAGKIVLAVDNNRMTNVRNGNTNTGFLAKHNRHVNVNYLYRRLVWVADTHELNHQEWEELEMTDKCEKTWEQFRNCSNEELALSRANSALESMDSFAFIRFLGMADSYSNVLELGRKLKWKRFFEVSTILTTVQDILDKHANDAMVASGVFADKAEEKQARADLKQLRREPKKLVGEGTDIEDRATRSMVSAVSVAMSAMHFKMQALDNSVVVPILSAKTRKAQAARVLTETLEKKVLKRGRRVAKWKARVVYLKNKYRDTEAFSDDDSDSDLSCEHINLNAPKRTCGGDSSGGDGSKDGNSN